MSVRFVLGRAGAGKTHHCLESIRAELRGSPLGPALMLLVPEQAAAQMERTLLNGGNLKGSMRAGVLSFRRLAYKLLSGSKHVNGIIPSVAERMILRHVLKEQSGQLMVYGAVTGRPGLVNQLLGNLKELIGEQVEPEQLREAAAGSANMQLSAKLTDLAMLLEAYRQYVGQHGLERAAALDELAEKIEQAAWLEGAEVWVDGFAGFTRQEMAALAALAERCRQMDICLLMEPSYSGVEAQADPLRLFGQTEQTYRQLNENFRDAGIAIEKPLRLSQAGQGSQAELARLEESLFRQQQKPNPKSSGEIGGEPSRIKLGEAPDRRSEVGAVVREILRLSRGSENPLRYRQMAVIVRDLAGYSDLLGAALTEHGIPFFIDRRYNLSHHALVELLGNALALIDEDFSQQAVRGLLKTGLLGIEQRRLDRLENYILAHGIKGAEHWLGEDWRHSGHMVLPGDMEDAQAEEQEDLANINATRRKVLGRLGDWCELRARAAEKRKVRDWAEAIVGLLEGLNVRQQLESWAKEAEVQGRAELAVQHRRVWECLAELLEQMVSVLGKEQIDISELQEILQAGMADFTLGLVPPMLDQVLVGSVERSRHPQLRAAFVLGMNEGVFPHRQAEDSVLSDRERVSLEQKGLRLGPGAEERFFQERLLAYIAFTRPRDYLWVSYAAADQVGKALNVSPFVGELVRSVPGLRVEKLCGWAELNEPGLATSKARLAGALARRFRMGFDGLAEQEQAKWLAAYGWLAKKDGSGVSQRILSSLVYSHVAYLDGQVKAELLGQMVRASKTQLESFAACPFQHFAMQILRLREREDASLEDVDLGRLYHRAMEELGRELLRSKSRLAQMSRAKAIERIRQIAGGLVESLIQTEPAMQSGRSQFLAANMQEQLAGAVAAGHRRSELGELYPAAVEQRFGMQGDKAGKESWPGLVLGLGKDQAMELRGIIDLLELAEKRQSGQRQRYAVVYDYKRSRSKEFKLGWAYYGLDLQLLIYLLAVRELGPGNLGGGSIVPIGGFYVGLMGAGIKSAKSGQGQDEDTDEEDLLARSRPSGMFRKDKLPLLDGTTQGRLQAVRGTITSTGELHRGHGDGLAVEDFETVLAYGRKKIRHLGHQLLAGMIGVEPYRLNGQMPCMYCKYRWVCRVDPLTRPYRELSGLDKAGVLALMGKEK